MTGPPDSWPTPPQPPTEAIPATPPGPPPSMPAPELPGDAKRTMLPERVVKYWGVTSALGWAMAIVASLAFTLVPSASTVALGVTALFVVGCLVDLVVIVPKRREQWWYAIGDEQIDLEHGWVVVRRVVIPMTRVQHVELERGPLADRFNLAELKIFTAAGMVKIPALDRQEGDRIRQQIAELARIADDL